VVVAVGQTETEPVLASTLPTFGVMATDVAFWTDQLSVVHWPAVMVAGLALNEVIVTAVGLDVVTLVLDTAER
jgi:hypothetical protein